ncbi:MAG: hypothetical protein M3O31_03780 [Acidobacteriota bacterium]|nr:hypothetical protein [Acidobacteriota bacterium]
MKSMSVFRKSATWFVLFAILTAPSLLRAQSGDHMSKDDVKALIGSAKTAEDHERLAKHFDAEADQLDAEATEHQELATEYKAHPSGQDSKHPMSGKTAGHCQYFADDLHKAATQARALAADHRGMAKETVR